MPTKKRKPPVSYGPGRVPRFTSPEALAKYLERVAKKQEKEKKGG